jgi:hypothetical protein
MSTQHPVEKLFDVPYLMEHALPGGTFMGAANGKPAFAYAMTTLCPNTGAHNSFIQQIKIIDVVGRCYGYTVEMNMIFLDIASEQCSTHRFGLKQLLIASKSPLLDADAVLMQSPDRLSRMPDELNVIKQALRDNDKAIVCSTTSPALSLVEAEASLGTSYCSGYPR